jgi:hypothetical protein
VKRIHQKAVKHFRGVIEDFVGAEFLKDWDATVVEGNWPWYINITFKDEGGNEVIVPSVMLSEDGEVLQHHPIQIRPY